MSEHSEGANVVGEKGMRVGREGDSHSLSEEKVARERRDTRCAPLRRRSVLFGQLRGSSAVDRANTAAPQPPGGPRERGGLSRVGVCGRYVELRGWKRERGELYGHGRGRRSTEGAKPSPLLSPCPPLPLWRNIIIIIGVGVLRSDSQRNAMPSPSSYRSRNFHEAWPIFTSRFFDTQCLFLHPWYFS